MSSDGSQARTKQAVLIGIAVAFAGFITMAMASYPPSADPAVNLMVKIGGGLFGIGFMIAAASGMRVVLSHV